MHFVRPKWWKKWWKNILCTSFVKMAEKIMHYVRQNGSSTDEQGKNDQFHSTSARNGCSLSMHNENRSIVVVQ